MTDHRRPRPTTARDRPAPAAPEDPALLTGEAKFTNDLDIPGALYLAVVRSPYAHARITSHRHVGRRGRCPASSPCYTGADLADAVGRADAVRLAGHRRHEEPGRTTRWRRTRRATSATAWPPCSPRQRRRRPRRDRARSTSSYEPLEAVIDLEDALSDRVVIHEDLGTNTQLHVGAQGRGPPRARSTRRSPPPPTPSASATSSSG